MSRLTKYLESLMSKKDSCKEAKTTSSIYYSIDGVKIRVSDHFPIDYSNDISIINPLNESTTYLVQVKEGPQVLQFSLKDLKVFIFNYCYIKKISSLNKEVKVAKKEFKQEEKKKQEEEKKLEQKRKLNSMPTSKGKTFEETLLNTLNSMSSKKGEKKKNLAYLYSVIPFTKDGLTWIEITSRLGLLFSEYSSISKSCKEILRKYLYNRSSDEIKELMTYLFNKDMFDDSDKLKNYFLYEEKREE